MKLQKTITVKTSFEALHKWATAPDEVAFLRNPHRHIFGVTAVLNVEHGDRALEFFCVKVKIENAIHDAFFASEDIQLTDGELAHNLGYPIIEKSCEDIAEMLFKGLYPYFPTLVSITVDEDGENSGTAIKLYQ